MPTLTLLFLKVFTESVIMFDSIQDGLYILNLIIYDFDEDRILMCCQLEGTNNYITKLF